MVDLGRSTIGVKLLGLGTYADDNAPVFKNAFGNRPEIEREFDVSMSIGKGGHDRGLGCAQVCVLTHDVDDGVSKVMAPC